MAVLPPFEIDISEPSAAFERHLTQEGNDRIFFSGAFGIGKTWFLERFFDNYKTTYLTFRLAPVHYSVSPNEDIFDLIKYHLLLQLIEHDTFTVDLINPAFDDQDFNRSFWLVNAYHLLSGLLVVAAELPNPDKAASIGATNFAGKTVGKLVQLIKTVRTEYEDSKTRMQDTPEKEALEGFNQRIQSLPFYRSPLIDQIIQRGLDQLRGANPESQTVLIIDDLDRLDPAHIFRLLNVFSVHFHEAGQNRFGFDKVILVGDIHNVRNIFQAQYGQETDFSGYIDKFFAREVFYFNNTPAITNCIEQILKSLSIAEEITYFRRVEWTEKTAPILSAMVLANAINLRALLRFQQNGQPVSVPSKSLHFHYANTSQKKNTREIWSIETLRFLCKLFGDYQAFYTAVKRTEAYFSATPNLNIAIDGLSVKSSFETYWAEMLFILDIPRHRFTIPVNTSDTQNTRFSIPPARPVVNGEVVETYKVPNDDRERAFLYIWGKQSHRYYARIGAPSREIEERISHSPDFTNQDFFMILRMALEFLHPQGIFS